MPTPHVESDSSATPANGAESLGLQKLQNESIQARQVKDMYEPVGNKILRTVSVTAYATTVGAVEYGAQHAADHPLQFAGELAAGVALPIALRGPAWVKVPATAVAVIGTAGFAVHIADAAREALPAISDLWESSTNTQASSQTIKSSLGPIAFDTTLMGVAGMWGNRAATRLHEVDPLALRAAFSERLSGLADAMGMSNQGEFALAGVGRIPAARIPEVRMPSRIADLGKPVEITNEPMMMTAHDASAGGGRGGGRGDGGAGADHYRYKQTRNGPDVVHDFVNARVGAIDGNTFKATDGTNLFFGHDGRVQISYGSGQVRSLNIGDKIGHVNIVEKPNGIKEFRFNGVDQPQVTSSPDGHKIKALLANGDVLRHIDVDGPTPFNHKDGLKTVVDPNGRVVFQLPGGATKVVTLTDRIGQARIIDKETGHKQLSFWNLEGKPHASGVDVPPLPKQAAQPKPNSLAQQWKDIQQRGTGGMEAGPTGAKIVSTVDMTSHSQPKGDENPFWRIPLPHSPHRAIVDTIVGIDHRTMPESDLRSPSELGLAIQDHNWVVKDFLAGLGKGGGNNGFDFDW